MGIKISEIAESINNIINQTFVEVSEKIGDTPVTKKFDLKNLQDQIDIKANLTQLQDVINQVLERIAGPSSATPNNVPVFGDSSGKTIVDSGISLQEIISAPVSEMVSGVPISGDENVAVFDGTSGKRIKDSNKNINDIVSIEGSATVNNVPMFSSQDGSVIKDSGKPADKLVTGPDTATGGNVPVFYDESGKSLSDSALSIIDVVRKTGAITAGNIPAFTGINGNTLVDSGKKAANIVMGPDSASDNAIVVFDGESGNVIRQSDKNVDDVVIGPTSSLVGSIPLFADESGKVIRDSAIKLEDVLQTLPADAVAGPSESIDGNIAVFDGVDGKKLRDAGIALNPLEVSETIYVSDNDTFTSITDAIEYVIKKYYPVGAKKFDRDTAPRVKIVVRAPITLNEQVIADGIDLSWITLTTEGNTIQVNTEYLTEGFDCGYPFLVATNRGKLPFLYNCSFRAVGNALSGKIGLEVSSGGVVFSQNLVFYDFKYAGIYVKRGFMFSDGAISVLSSLIGTSYGIFIEQGALISTGNINAGSNVETGIEIGIRNTDGFIMAFNISIGSIACALNASRSITIGLASIIAYTFNTGKGLLAFDIFNSYLISGGAIKGERKQGYDYGYCFSTFIKCTEQSRLFSRAGVSSIKNKVLLHCENSSEAYILGSGPSTFNSSEYALVCENNSKILFNDYPYTSVYNSQGKLIKCSNHSYVYMNGVNAHDTYNYQFFVDTPGYSTATGGIECTNRSKVVLGIFRMGFTSGTGILCDNGSEVKADDTLLYNPIDGAIKCTGGSSVYLKQATIGKVPALDSGAVFCDSYSKVYMPQTTFIDVEGDLIKCSDGSEVYAKGSSLTLNDPIVNTGNGVVCSGGSKVNVQDSDFSGVGVEAVTVSEGGLVYAHGLSGNITQTKNTLLPEGLIWADAPV